MNVQGTPLQTGYSFYYMRRSKKGNTAVLSEAEPDAQASLKDRASFTDAVKLIGTARTIEEFWGIYNHLVRPSDLPATTDYHFFREGVKPTWEDPYNGKCKENDVMIDDRDFIICLYLLHIVLICLTT